MIPRKRFGQHFLHDPRILGRIADAAGIMPGDTVLEIGPGPGGLTAELARRATRLVAIHEADALDTDWHALAGPPPVRIVGNIPYNITSPLLEQALTPPRPAVIVFLVQKEVAERIAAAPGGADYGALSVGVQAVALVERLFTVPAGAFKPPPKVDSAVVRLTPRAEPLIADADVGPFRQFVVGLFGFRRKQLVRGLRELTGAAPETALAWLGRAGIAPETRPQELSPEDFARLFGLRPAA